MRMEPPSLSVLAVDLDGPADEVDAALRRAAAEGRTVVALASPSSRLAPALRAIREGIVRGVLAKPASTAAFLRVARRRPDPARAYREVLHILRGTPQTELRGG